MGPVFLESFRQPFVFGHLSHSLDAFRHNNSDERNPADVTRRSTSPWKHKRGTLILVTVATAGLAPEESNYASPDEKPSDDRS
jgi:hypothetical protein